MWERLTCFFLLEYIATCGMLSSLDDRLMIPGDKDGWESGCGCCEKLMVYSLSRVFLSTNPCLFFLMEKISDN